MSKTVSALNGADFDGLARVHDTGLRGMITLRGAFSLLEGPATRAAGVAMPEPLTARLVGQGGDGQGGLLWMSPDELLLLCPYDEAPAKVQALTEELGDAFAMAVNVSDARACFRVSGPKAREVLAKLAPLDFSPEAFPPGTFRRTRLAQVSAAIWAEEDGSFGVICFRSVARYAFDLLCTAANVHSEVGVY